MIHAGKKLRELMKQGCVTMPGVFNGFVARLAVEAGFDACYVSGAAVSACTGVPDIGLVNVDTFSKVIKEVTGVSNLPCIADADTGFGEAEMVTRAVFEYHSAGAAGLHLEDQVFPKRCGHLDGKQLVPVEEFCDKIRRAVEAANRCSKGDFLVCARTDAAGVEGVEAAIARAAKYVDSGADMIFPEGLRTEGEFERFASAMKGLRGNSRLGGPYLLANMTEFGKTPFIPVAKFAHMGYDCVIFPVSTFRIAMKPVKNLLKQLKEKGTVEDLTSDMYTRQELYDTLKYVPGKEWTFPAI